MEEITAMTGNFQQTGEVTLGCKLRSKERSPLIYPLMETWHTAVLSVHDSTTQRQYHFPIRPEELSVTGHATDALVMTHKARCFPPGAT